MSAGPGLTPDGAVAIVTGAAGGIGAAVAQRLLERGASVTLSDLDAERLAALHREAHETCFIANSVRAQVTVA